jgi:uncharacterized protein YggU (UPF0235/DUF167 family)
MRIAVRVRPGASRTEVGGRYGESDVLVVAVSARAVDGAATEATRRALAEAFAVRRSEVSLVSGATSREKVFEVRVSDPAEVGAKNEEGAESVIADRLAALLDR